jgi:hypothetical protein
MTKFQFEDRLDWRHWVTPKLLEEKPIHRWYVFPHSFTSELVHALIDEWGLGPKDRILDPFVGAGTTVLAAKEKGIPANGYDLSPLAVLATRAKIANYDLPVLEDAWRALRRRLDPARWNGVLKSYPDLVSKALPGRLLGAFEGTWGEIDHLHYSDASRNFFRLALLSIVPRFSRAVATGGWLSWVDKRQRVGRLPEAFSVRVEKMLADLREATLPRRTLWRAECGDARRLPDRTSTYSAVITSPPYPNRHDYTRVFGVELMFAFLGWEEARRLRYQSFHSHPEAKPRRPAVDGYVPPKALVRSVARIRKVTDDVRVPRLLEGYFLDLYICLQELRRVCRPRARIALVVGNAQYCGEPVLVDELTAEIGEQVGLTCRKILAVRYRGNSSQQMRYFGRIPSRESVVVFER